MPKDTAKIIQLFKRPTLTEYQNLITDWYETDPEIFLILLATRQEGENGERYDLTYLYEADSDEDFINMLENIIENVKTEED